MYCSSVKSYAFMETFESNTLVNEFHINAHGGEVCICCKIFEGFLPLIQKYMWNSGRS